MQNWISRTFHKISDQETFPERSSRMVPGAIFAFIAASAYSLTLSLINPLTYPGLHLGIDWTRLISYWIGFGIALAVAGLLVGWFTENYMGIIVGGLILTGLLLLGNLLVSLISHSGVSLAAQSVVVAIPLVGACILVAGGIRLTIIRYGNIVRDVVLKSRRKLLLGLVGIVFLVGFIPGALGRYDGATAKVIQIINSNMAAAKADPATAQGKLPITKFPALKDHLGMNYTLSPRTSTQSAGTMDLTFRFQDGWTLTCNVSNTALTQIYLTDCSEGNFYVAP